MLAGAGPLVKGVRGSGIFLGHPKLKEEDHSNSRRFTMNRRFLFVVVVVGALGVVVLREHAQPHVEEIQEFFPGRKGLKHNDLRQNRGFC